MTNNVNLREISLDILMEINEKDQYVHILLSEALTKYQYLEKKERAFISRLVRGTIERRITLDYCLNHVSKVPVNKMKPLIRNLLRMSAYQLIYMDKAAEHVVCDEAVKLAKKRGFSGLTGFVNGVLRNLIRQLPTMNLDENLSVKYSVPEWMAGFLSKKYSKETAEVIFESFLTDKNMSVMVNTLKLSKEELTDKLSKEGVKVATAPYVENALYVSDINYLEKLDSFVNGELYIQDISSQIAMNLAGITEGMKIIDVCAAPGGKSIMASLIMKGTGEVISRDLTDSKTSLICDNIDRLGIDNITVQVYDAAKLDEELIESADLVIADLPCSGLGIVGRKPDIKYNMTPEKMHELADLQKQILSVVTKYVKPGGMIQYSTCTLDPYENEDNFKYIESLGFTGVNLAEGKVYEGLKESAKNAGDKYLTKLETEAKNGYITLIPGIYECDGFFVSRLRKDK